MNFTLFKLVELKVLNPSLRLCFYLPLFCLSLGSYFNLCYASALKCLSVCPLYPSFCLLCPVLAASTNRAVLAEYIKSIFVSIFVSFGCTVLMKNNFVYVFVWCDNDLSDDLTDSHGPDRRSFWTVSLCR